MAALRVDIAPDLLDWAARRSRVDREDLDRRFPKLEEWEAGTTSPTVKQLERYAAATHTPFGMFFLPAPPEETLPLPDFRTIKDQDLAQPSADLIDVIGICERRQEWFAEFARTAGHEELDFVGSLDVSVDPIVAAEAIRTRLGFSPDTRKNFGTWEEALRRFIEHAEDLGVLVMVSGVVGANTHRKLDPQEFRGFAMIDPIAPVIFVNGADAKAAQNFTVAHELAHVWLGVSGVSNVSLRARELQPIERWCNRVAAELLVPIASFRSEYRRDATPREEARRLARFYKVSGMVILRRAFEVQFIDWDTYVEALTEEERLAANARQGTDGGNFYNTLPVWVSKTFARAVVADTLEGRTLYRDAFRLLGFRKAKTFNRLREELGVH